MNKISKLAPRMKAIQDKPEMTMGIDVGDRYSHVCLLDDEGEVVERDRVRSPIQTESSSSASSSVAP